MDDAQLLRYSRHIMLPEVGIEGQEALLKSHALIIGAGGLGSAAALYMASAGVGHITLIDDDRVELTNLQRQIAHTTARVGQPKVDSAANAMQQINPTVRVDALAQRADASWLAANLASVDVVLDCSDNFATRQAVNRACVQAQKPLVWAAAVQMDAQLGFYAPQSHSSACYACVFPEESGANDANCATMGVLGPLVGAVGSLQAAMALQWLSQQPGASPDNGGPSMVAPPLREQILLIDLRHWGFDSFRVTRRADCPVCHPHKGDSDVH